MKLLIILIKVIFLKIKLFFVKNKVQNPPKNTSPHISNVINDPRHLLHLIRKHEKDQWIIIEKTLLNTLIEQYQASNKRFN